MSVEWWIHKDYWPCFPPNYCPYRQIRRWQPSKGFVVLLDDEKQEINYFQILKGIPWPIKYELDPYPESHHLT